jgi:hypothetical protein
VIEAPKRAPFDFHANARIGRKLQVQRTHYLIDQKSKMTQKRFIALSIPDGTKIYFQKIIL